MADDDKPEFDSVQLWSADSIVLHDWLDSIDLDALPITHPAQKQALADLLNALQMHTRAEYATADEVAAAQERVARDMGW